MRHLDTEFDVSDGDDVTDRYLVSPISSVNAKVRDGRIEIKRMLRVRDGFQQWCPTWKVSEPFSVPTVIRLFGELGVAPPRDADADWSATRSLADVTTMIEQHDDLRVIPVAKSRRKLTMDGVDLEFTDVERDEETIATLALDGTDLDALRRVRAALGLDDAENLSVNVAVAQPWDTMTGVH